MLRAFTTLVLATTVSFAALAQSGTGTTNASPDNSVTTTQPPAARTKPPAHTAPAPGTTGGRRTLSRGPMLPGGDSPARETRQGGGTADLNNNSATIGPTGVGPTAVGPTGVGPTGLGSPSSSGMATSRSAPMGPGTGAPDRGVPDSSVYNPGVGSR